MQIKQQPLSWRLGLSVTQITTAIASDPVSADVHIKCSASSILSDTLHGSIYALHTSQIGWNIKVNLQTFTFSAIFQSPSRHFSWGYCANGQCPLIQRKPGLASATLSPCCSLCLWDCAYSPGKEKLCLELAQCQNPGIMLVLKRDDYTVVVSPHFSDQTKWQPGRVCPPACRQDASLPCLSLLLSKEYQEFNGSQHNLSSAF